MLNATNRSRFLNRNFSYLNQLCSSLIMPFWLENHCILLLPCMVGNHIELNCGFPREIPSCLLRTDVAIDENTHPTLLHLKKIYEL